MYTSIAFAVQALLKSRVCSFSASARSELSRGGWYGVLVCSRIGSAWGVVERTARSRVEPLKRLKRWYACCCCPHSACTGLVAVTLLVFNVLAVW